MQVCTERNESMIIASVMDRIDGTNAQEFQQSLLASIDSSVTGMVLDLSELSYISSAGLRVILLVAKALTRHNARLVACSLSDPIREVFEISGFDKIITTLPSRADAIAAL